MAEAVMAPVPRRRWRRWAMATLAVGAVMGVVAVAAGSWYWLSLRPPEPPRGPDQRPARRLEADPDPARGSFDIQADGLTAPGPDVTVAVVAPPGATGMQVGFDPTFTTVDWQPVRSEVTVRPGAQGYQMLFGRFRNLDGTISAVSVDGITLDATYGPAIASAQGRHRASWARPLSATTVVLRIEAGRLERGVQQPYDFDRPPPGDAVDGWFGQFRRRNRWRQVNRDGQPFGRQVAGSERLLRPYDRLVGRPLAVEALLAGTWRITSPDDPAYAAAPAPEALNRSSRPLGTGQGPGDELVVAMVHDITLELPSPLLPGRHYRVEPPEDLVEPYEWEADPAAVSPAVQVNQNGYAPGDGLKVGYLSGPLAAVLPAGTRLPYQAGLGFEVVDAATGRTVVSGLSTGRPGGDELGRGDLTGSPVYELDFSALEEPGRYRLCVNGVGCSEEFPVAATVWRDLTVTVARAMYHQRSGLSLGPPYSAIGRARPRHPDDGTVVNATPVHPIDLGDSDDALFAALAAGRTGETVPGAWGGHFDAGDWDRRSQHLWYVRAVAEVVEARPEVYGRLDLNLPESGDAVPDLLDEGLWTLDLFRRLQTADGAVRAGVEASEHPPPDTTSWTDDLELYTYAPDLWSTYLYAGVAAETAAVLEHYDRGRAQEYLDSARAAMAWAEAQPAGPAHAEAVAGQRSVAAAALLKATGEPQWHQVFLDATTLDDGLDRFLSCHEHNRCDAAWLYWTADTSVTDPQLRALIGQSLVATAEEILAGAATTAYGWTVENTSVPLIWGLGVGGAPHATALLRAWAVSGEARHRAGAERAAAVSLGANPLGTVFVTGVGRQPVRHPLIVDVAHGGLPVWAGTPVYGAHQLRSPGPEAWVDDYTLAPAGTFPLGRDLPYLWQWFDVSNVAMFNEFTVFQSHADAVYAYGLLS